MATPAQPPAVHRATAKSSAFPMIVLIAGWLVPGLGHILVGKKVRALLIFVSILGMYLIGLSLAGTIYVPGTGDILDLLGFIGELGLGVLYVIARVFSLGASSSVNVLSDYGGKAIVIAGLLNVISAVDAHSLANGRKASF